MDRWYILFKMVTGTFQWVFISNVIVIGKENLNPGPKIYAGNHPNTSEVMILPNIVPDRIHNLMYADTFKMPIWGWLLTLSGQIPVAPGLGKSAMDEASKRLLLGKSVAISPEGQMTLRSEKREPGTLAVRLAIITGVPIIPISFYVPGKHIRTLKFSWFGKPKISRWQIRGKCYVSIGKPWYPAKSMKNRPNSKQIRQLTHQLMTRIEEHTLLAMEQAQL